MREKGISLVGFKTVKEVANFIDSYPDAKFELAYNMSTSFLEEVTPLIKGRVLSLHATCPLEDWFANFASFDDEVIKESFDLLERSALTAKSFGAKIIVLHPGYLTNCLVSSNYEGRKALMNGPEFKPFIGRQEGYIARVDILSTDGYLSHLNAMMPHLDKLTEHLLNDYGITLAVENLNPRAGYLFMQPQEINYFPSNIHFCLDVGHLWMSSHLFGFDFLDAVKSFMESGRVVSVHLHSNGSNGQILEDTHQALFANNFPALEVINILKQYPVNLILETLGHELENAHFLDKLLALENITSAPHA